MIDINEIYRQLSYHHLDKDDEQELAIQIWTARESYDENKGTVSTWISTIVKNYSIAKIRSKKEKERNLQIPLSNFEREREDGTVYSTIDSYLVSAELSPIDQLIDKENVDKIMRELYSLKNPHRDILLARANGEKNDSLKYVRAKEAFKKKRYKYVLKNLDTGQEYNVNTFVEAAEITEYTHSRVLAIASIKEKFGEINGKYFQNNSILLFLILFIYISESGIA